MVHICIENGVIKELNIKGEFAEIGADTCQIINTIFNVINGHNKELAEIFKTGMREEIQKDDIFQVIEKWEEVEDADKKVDNNEDKYDDAVKMVKDIIDNKNEGDINNG